MFSLKEDYAYQTWREHKLSCVPRDAEDLIVEVKDPAKLSVSEKAALAKRLTCSNMAIYTTQSQLDKASVLSLGSQFNLHSLDQNIGANDQGITEVEVKKDALHKRYIPYTNNPIRWHTDGYYNLSEKNIHAFILHCDTPALEGGNNALLDHELAYIHLRDTNPDYIQVLMRADVMTIPANIVDGKQTRAAQTGPVFSIDGQGHLHMRYTARTRSIEWKDDPVVAEAVEALVTFLNSDYPYIYRVTMQTGQGLICNNVLHNRTAFNDSDTQVRLLYRLRYYERFAA